MKITTTGVLLSTPLISSTATSEIHSARSGRPPTAASSRRAPVSSAPVCASPWPMTISPSSASSAGLAKPESSASASSRLPPAGPATGNR